MKSQKTIKITKNWSGWRDLNPRPLDPQSSALPGCATPRYVLSILRISFRDSTTSISKLREIYGSEINISGGLSNVSFGLPRRKLVNDVFVNICINRGLDSGIIDPIQIKIDEIKNLDESTKDYKVAEDMLMGKDDFCMNYITFCREG